MLEGAVLVYGMVAMFVLSSAQRNRRTFRPHASALLYTGWLLVGSSLGGAGLLGLVAVRQTIA
jgi:hypothetical protein